MLNHPEERRRMGEAGWRLVHERFDMRVAAVQLADIYRELAEQACKKNKNHFEKRDGGYTVRRIECITADKTC